MIRGRAKTSMTTTDELLEVERKMWTNEVDVYATTFLPDALLIFAETGKIDLPTALDALRNESKNDRRWAEVSLDDARIISLGVDAAVLTYVATARWNYEEKPGKWLCSTVYLRRSEGWRIALHQQTLPPAK
jgi:hypothetical protein